GTVCLVEGRDRQEWTLVPPPPAVANTAAATGAAYDPRVGSGASASAALTVPIASALMHGNMPFCEVTTTPSSACARAQSRYNIEGRGTGDCGGNRGTRDALPGWSIRCGELVKIGLVLLLLVAETVIVTVVFMTVVLSRDGPVTTATVVSPSWKQQGATIVDDGESVALSADVSIMAMGDQHHNVDNTVVSPSWKQHGATIVGDGESVALSADASIMAIGNHHHNDDMGSVKVYRTDDVGNRVQLGQTIYGDAGRSMDITPDGNTLAIGSTYRYLTNTLGIGYVRVFSLESDTNLGTRYWKKIGQDIIIEGNGDQSGPPVSISEDGRMIAVGAPSYEEVNGMKTDPGHVRIYHLVNNGTSWQKIGQDINGESAGDHSGASVSLSANGSTVAIGAPRHGNNGYWLGQVAVYRINSEGSSWEQLGQTIYGDSWDEAFGISMDITPDGNTLAIGSGLRERVGGGVKVFSLTSGIIWNQIGQLSVGDCISVSLSDDGKTLAIGMRFEESEDWYQDRVSVHRLDESKSNWIQIGDDINGATGNHVLGSSVSLSADGNKVAMGSTSNEGAGDYVRVYVLI
ncbi:hypothetical protein ACHAXA_009255, partial [Cyclostephanos tholiformis]